MAVMKGNSPLSCSPICYKIRYLTEAILDATQICNLEDRYLLGEQLGWGQFGVIRSCSDKLTGEILACKSIAKDRLVTLDDVRSVKLEIEIMAQLSGHPNIVELKAVFEEEDYVHLVMELCAGGELFHRLEKHGHFPEREAALLFKPLMEVVKYCHDKGVVHRDLKPENILLANTSLTAPIKLADFGLATYIRPGQSLHGVVGSPFYIAPEVLAGGYNQAADVWSAGVILYILLSGVPPFWGKTKSKIFYAVRSAEVLFPSDPWDQISRSAKDLIMGMLCRDPSQRLTAAQVLDHCWIKNSESRLESKGRFLSEGVCFPKVISLTRDFSLHSGNAVFGDLQDSPVFTCKSSFSSFLIDAPTSPPSVGFSFGSHVSNNQEVASPIVSFPSFAFFTPCTHMEQKHFPFSDNDVDNSTALDRYVSFGKMAASSPTYQRESLDARKGELSEMDSRREVVAATRPSGIHTRRNHTIGLGELEQLDLMVTESIIRWASCTNLSTATSFRSSLVC